MLTIKETCDYLQRIIDVEAFGVEELTDKELEMISAIKAHIENEKSEYEPIDADEARKLSEEGYQRVMDDVYSTIRSHCMDRHYTFYPNFSLILIEQMVKELRDKKFTVYYTCFGSKGYKVIVTW